MARPRLIAALLLCLAGAILSLILLSTHYGVPLLGEAVLAACGEGGGCDAVSQSRYSKIFGLPLAALGLFLYGALFALLLPGLFGKTDETSLGAPSLVFLLAATAVGVDVILLGLQAFVIKAFCKFCVATYFVNLGLVAVLWPARRPALARAWFISPESRREVTALIFAIVSIAIATLTANTALADRQSHAAANVLGIPFAPPSSVNAEKGSLEKQLEEAQAEARKWKETLDNETRLQIYLNEKAKSDFNASEAFKVDVSRAPSQGPAEAPIGAVSYSDFMCPFCRDLALGLKSYLPNSGNRVKTYYKHFPLDKSCNPGIGRTMHPGACELSLAGICAQDNGRFWEFHDKVFSRTWDKASREDALGIGVSVGLDRAKLATCMDGAATRGRLAKDIEEGFRVGVESTPTVLVNGRKLKSTSLFLIAVEEERKRLNLSPQETAPRK
jgi:protein-disulfide isomerase/uncharacterized membrane protein